MLPEIEKQNLIHAIEEAFGLVFLEKDSTSNLCYADKNEELRDEFKGFFNQEDLTAFINSFGDREIRLPATETEFWQKVKEGKI